MKLEKFLYGLWLFALYGPIAAWIGIGILSLVEGPPPGMMFVRAIIATGIAWSYALREKKRRDKEATKAFIKELDEKLQEKGYYLEIKK